MDKGKAKARLFRGKGCGSAMVEAAFALAGQPLELVAASRWEGKENLPALERVNPLGQVPTLVWPDGTVQTESAAILIETALRFPDAGLLPQRPGARATALRWLAFLPANIYAAYNPHDFPGRWLDDESQHAALVEGATRRIEANWRIVETQFVPVGPFAFGDRPGALDIAVAVMSRWTPGREWFAAECPRLRRMVDAVDAHPALAPVWRDNFS
jgi:GST-like protein